MSFSRELIQMAKRPHSRWRLWLTTSAVVLLVLGGLLTSPGRLAMSERLDPLVRAEEMISRGQVADALKLLTRMQTAGLDAWEVRKILLQRAVCQKSLGRYGEALAGFQALEGEFEAIRDYLIFWQAACLEGLGQPEGAASHYTRILEMQPPSLLRDSATLRAASLHLDRQRPAEAAAIYRLLLGRSQQEVAALVGLAGALEAAGDSAGARSTRLRLVRDYPERFEAVDALGRIGPLKQAPEFFYGGVAYARNKQYRKAKPLFRKIVRASSDGNWRGRAQYELAQVYYETKNYRTAERAFEKAYQAYRVPKALFDKARCSVRLGRDLEAAERFQTFARLYPKVTGADEALWNAGMAYERQDRHGQAREVYLQLAKRYPMNDFADKGMWRAGFALYKMGDYEASARAFLRLANQTSETYLRDQGFYWAGKCYQKLGEEEAAGFWTRKAAEGFPISYYSSRARVVLGLNREAYPEVAQMPPEAAEARYEPSVSILRGDLLASLGLYRLAEREYGQAERVHRNDLFALDGLLQRYERIRAMTRALRVSNLIVALEQQQGMPMTLASFRRLYPIYYWGEINRAAQEIDLDPNLILAIMRQESAFNEGALSPVGARGLMQVMPATGRAVARQIPLKGFRASDLWKPQTSIRLGGRHLSDHLRQFKEEDDRRLGLALSAYNAGLKAARRWSRRLPGKDVDEFVESIPYRETRNYVKLVYRNYQVYSYLQGDDPQPVQELVQ